MATADVKLSLADRARLNLRYFRRDMDTMSKFFLIMTFGFFFFFLVVPLSLVVVQAFLYDGHLSLQNFFDVLFNDSSHQFLNLDINSWGLDKMIHLPTDDDKVLRITGINSSLLINSVFVGIFTTFFSVVIGVSLAFIIARYDFPGKGCLPHER